MDEIDLVDNEEETVSKLRRLRVRRDALSEQASQLAARSSHLERVLQANARQLARRRETHNKIVLGALLTMVGLHRFQTTANGEPVVVDIFAKRALDVTEPATFDTDLLIGALLSLSLKLNVSEIHEIEYRNVLRKQGAAFRKRSKLARRGVLKSALSKVR